MAVYISLLRGINVSGQKKVNMKDLKLLYESLQLSNVVTYLQSGNVAFTNNEHSKEKLKTLIESAIEKQYLFNVPVIVMYQEELNNALNNLPFEGIVASEQGSQTMFSFLSGEPVQTSFNELTRYKATSEELKAVNNVVYLFCPNGYGKTKLTNNLLENKLNLISTTRNLKTIIKLQSILSGISASI